MEPDITRQLREGAAGDEEAIDRVWVSVYGELRRLAHRRLHGEQDGHTLSTTALVHEAYLKLVPGRSATPRDRRHFMALASRAMRQILVDYARARARLKRGGGRAAVTFEDATYAQLDPVREPETFIALDEALTRLQKTQPRLVQVVELRFFAGMSLAEIGEVLDVHERTVERDWRRARAYLFRLLSPD